MDSTGAVHFGRCDGFSTYEMVCRTKDIFCADKILTVSQEYHLYRVLHIADAFGIEACGVASNYREYYGQTNRDTREVLARVKNFTLSSFQPEPTYPGETIPISGSGELTHDKNSDFQ